MCLPIATAGLHGNLSTHPFLPLRNKRSKRVYSSRLGPRGALSGRTSILKPSSPTALASYRHEFPVAKGEEFRGHLRLQTRAGQRVTAGGDRGLDGASAGAGARARALWWRHPRQPALGHCGPPLRLAATKISDLRPRGSAGLEVCGSLGP